MLATAFAAAQTPAPAPVAQTDSSASAPEVTFKVEVNYVEEDVRVVDPQGNFVKGLTREDFQLAEDEKPQKINTFGLVDVPLVPLQKPLFLAKDALPIEPEVASNEQVLDSRLYLILLDDYHVDPLRTQKVRNLARRFVLEKMGANDQAAVVVTSGSTKGSQDFTQNRRLLLEAIDQFMGQKLRSATLAKIDARARERPEQGDPTVAPLDNEKINQTTPKHMQMEDEDAAVRGFKDRATLTALRSISEWMSVMQGRRKAIVYISEGVDYNLFDMYIGADPSFENFSMIQQETWDALSAASRSNVQIYPIDPRGLTDMALENVEIMGVLQTMRFGQETVEQELMTSELNLRLLAEETGGVAAVGTNDIDKAFDRIVQENSSYYVLGYYPTNEKRDGKLRTISVKVNGYPDAQVTFRKRYAAPLGKTPKNAAVGKVVAPAAGLTAELMQTLASPLPKTGLPLRIMAVPHKGVGKTTELEVLIATGGKELTFKENAGTFNNVLSLSIGVFDKKGKSVAGERPDIALALKPETHARVLQNGFRVLRHLSVPPGRYQLRVAAQDSAKTRQGSAHLDIDVPDFTKDPIALSGIALAASADASLYSWNDPFGGWLPGPPTALREFPASTEMVAYVEVYDNQPTPPHRLDITTKVRADDGHVVFNNSEERTSEDLHGTPGAFGYTVRIQMAGWAPGLYVLSIDAKSRIGNAEPISRVIQFKVRG